MTAPNFKIGLIQLSVGNCKHTNLQAAVDAIHTVRKNSAEIAVLPECFNSPYGIRYFPHYAEKIPDGETCQTIAECAKQHKMFVVAGSIPEVDGSNYYNTSTVWNPDGKLVTKFRKIHLFDIDIPGKITFKESEVLNPGNSLSVFNTGYCKIGLGICYDVRFFELAAIYRNQGCDMILYPGAFNMTTGPIHWQTLLKARAIDNQLYVAGISPARNPDAEYVAWGHTTLIDPYGEVVCECNGESATSIIYGTVDMNKITNARQQIPVSYQRRPDLYSIEYHNEKNGDDCKNPSVYY